MSLAHSLWKRIEYRDKIHHANVLRSFPDELVPGQRRWGCHCTLVKTGKYPFGAMNMPFLLISLQYSIDSAGKSI